MNSHHQGRAGVWSAFLATMLFTLAGLGAVALPQAAQAAGLPLTFTTPVTQNLDTLGTAAIAELPGNFKVDNFATVRTVGTWTAAASATDQVDGDNMSATAAAGTYNFGAGAAASATDRAAGFLSSDTATQSGNLYGLFENTTGESISYVTIAYNVEKYRNGSNAAGYSMQLYYSTDGSSWSNAGPSFLNSFTPDADDLGYATAPGSTTAVTSMLALPTPLVNSGNLYLAWNYSVTSGTTTANAQALAVDDVSVVAINSYTITATAGLNGTVTPAGVTTVNSGASQAYTIAADPGYHIADVLVDGVSQGATASHTFTDVVANHTIDATFAVDVVTYTITATAGLNGTVTPAGVTTVNSGASQAYTIAADPGYEIADVLVDASSIGAVASYSFTNVTANHTISATFSILPPPATVSAVSPSGVISPNTPSVIVPVNIVRPYATANRLFHVRFQLGDGLALSGGTGGITQGSFLSSNGATTHFQVVDNGGGSYTADGSILGLPCNATGLSGNLFNIAVASNAATGPGSVTLTDVVLRDCDNNVLPSSLGTAASVAIDNTSPAVAVTAPNGGETWFPGDSRNITWTATDAGGFGPGSVSLDLSTDDGASWSSIATGLANSGSYAWTVPVTASILARVRVNATDANGNVGLDASDAVFAIGTTSSVVINSTPNPSGSGDAVLLSATVTHVAPAVGVPSGSVTFYDGPTSIATGTLNTSGIASASVSSLAIGTHSLTAAYGGSGTFSTSTSTALSQEVKAKIVASAGANGSVAPSGTTTYSLNATPTFMFTANAGYHVADVLVDGASAGPMPSYTFAALTANHTLAVSFAINPAVAAISGLAAVQVKSGNDLDGTTKVALTWPSVGADKTVKVYRSGYGNYPEYDDAPNAGSVPPTPSYPPPTTWQLTSVGVSGDADEVTTRGLWYYVAFVQDQYGTISPVSNRTGGTLNYHLGDVSDGTTPAQGDNTVDMSDITLLGAHYGLTGAAVTAYDYLDVGPTTTHSVDGRPLTDNSIDFEDLVMFAINYHIVSAPQAGIQPVFVAAESDAIRLEVPATFTQGRITARLQMSGTGVVQGLSAKLAWDTSVVAVESFAPGALLDNQGAVALSGRPGVVDIVRLGAGGGIVGSGEVAAVTFRRIGEGEPMITLGSVDARDAANAPVAMTLAGPNPKPVPLVTSFERVAPNPTRGNATLSFALAQGGPVELVIYGVDGRLVRSLLRSTRESGTYQIAWDGRDDAGRTVAVGVYYARLVTQQGRFTRSLVYLE